MDKSRSESEKIKHFVGTYTQLSSKARRVAIQALVATLDSDEMDMVIEAIDTKIDNVAATTTDNTENESLEDSGVSSISPSETNFDQVGYI